MTIYSWGAESPISQVEITPYGKSKEAVIHLNPSAKSGALSALPGIYFALGYSAFPHKTETGETILRVRGIKENAHALAVLQDAGLADIRQAEIKEPARQLDKRSFFQKAKQSLQKKSLYYTGLVYLTADITLMVAGWKHLNEANMQGKKDRTSGLLEMGAGLLYASTGVGLMAFGYTRADKAYQIKHDEFLGYLAKEGATIANFGDKTPEKLGKPDGLLGQATGFLRKHPAESLDVANIYAGIQLTRAGLTTASRAREAKNEGLDARQGGPTKALAGGVVTSGLTAALLIPEKDPDPNKPKPTHFLGRFWQKIQSNPQIVGGTGAIINNGIQTLSAFQERKGYVDIINRQGNMDIQKGMIPDRPTKANGETAYHAEMGKYQNQLGQLGLDEKQADTLRFAHNNQHNYRWNLATAGINFAANILLAISPKTMPVEEVEGSTRLRDDMIALAAQHLAVQPGDIQEQLIQKAAYKLSEDTIFKKTTAAEIEAEIRSGVDALAQGPFSRREVVSNIADQPTLQQVAEVEQMQETPQTAEAARASEADAVRNTRAIQQQTSFAARESAPAQSHVEEAAARASQSGVALGV